MVFEHGLHLRVGLPTAGGRGNVRDADAPLLLGKTGDRGTSLAGLAAEGAGAAVGEGSGIGRMLENRKHGRHPRCLPDQIAKTIPTGQQQRVAIERVDHFAGRATLQKRLEHQRQAGLRFLVGNLEHLTLPVAHQTRRQGQGQLPALRLVDQSGGQAGCHGVTFPCRQGALASQQEPAVDGRRIIDAIAIGDQAPLGATQVQQRIPVRAVA
jgi:hypothetical protein